jgi:5-methylcytosine-specific restriction endonuclease McrA
MKSVQIVGSKVSATLPRSVRQTLNAQKMQPLGVKSIMSRRTDKEAAIRFCYVSYRQSANKFGREFRLTEADVSTLVTGSCHYCGRLPFSARKPKGLRTETVPLNGIDRVDSALGYTPENVVTACKHCNLAKLDLPYEEFLTLCRLVADRHRS